MKTAIFSMATALLVAMPAVTHAALAEVLIEQDFGDTSVFSPGISGWHGDAGTTDGRWGDFNPSNGPFITDDFSVSGGQAMTVRRGGNIPLGRVDNPVTEDEFEISYWLYRDSSDSNIMVQVGNSNVASQVQLGVFLNNNVINVRNETNSGWMSTNFGGADLGEWLGIRQHVFVGENDVTFDLYRTRGLGGTEQSIGTYTIPDVPEDIDRLRFNPQGTTGNLTHVDQVSLSQVPEPSSLALLGACGLGLLARRRVRR